MEPLFLCIIVFVFLLAVFDLWAGVSNDAVNFLNSAIGTKAASLKHIIIVASIGVFMGAAMSNGMMDIARHGIFQPAQFSFYDLICVFMAVMVTDIILLDIFNTLGMPTSTTVSMVFELLGASFVVALMKISSTATDLGFSDMLNTEKALTVIIGIFTSVAIAFVFGTLVQFISRLIFSFNYNKNLKWKIGIFGGLCTTAIIYFVLIKGAKDLAFMTDDVKTYIEENTGMIITTSFIVFTLLMQLLHALRINVLKVVVMMGTFALALAFAGNDLVNFIGVPLAGLESYNAYIASGGGDANNLMMDVLNGPSTLGSTMWFLIAAGAIMVFTLATSEKVRRVSQTSIGLSSQNGGDEMFGSSRIARQLVRWSLKFSNQVASSTPRHVRSWINRRFNIDETIMENGAAFDLVRGSINLVLAGALIALGTSMQLPLSTTFVTFMVAMGTSLADRAWGRESAVFRITGVISVIGGWFITAGAAFIGAGIIVLVMHLGGIWIMFALAALTIFLIIHSNRRFSKKKEEDDADTTLFQTILATKDPEQVWPMFLMYSTSKQTDFMTFASNCYQSMTQAFVDDNVRALDLAERQLMEYKRTLKNSRRKETLCLRKLTREQAIEKSTWFYLGNNSCMSVLYNLRRINEICKEHVENNFLPLPEGHRTQYEQIRGEVSKLFNDTLEMIASDDTTNVNKLRRHCDEIKDMISDSYHNLYDHLREDSTERMTVLYVYLNMLQETREMVSTLRKYMRAFAKMRDNSYSGRPGFAN